MFRKVSTVVPVCGRAVPWRLDALCLFRYGLLAIFIYELVNGSRVGSCCVMLVFRFFSAALLGTHTEKGAGTFWDNVSRLPLEGNPIVAWKFCHVFHKLMREGHSHVSVDSLHIS